MVEAQSFIFIKGMLLLILAEVMKDRKERGFTIRVITVTGYGFVTLYIVLIAASLFFDFLEVAEIVMESFNGH